jgi:Rieske Fe-S protein
MNRNEFIKTCGLACIGATALSTLLQSCVNSKMITAQIIGDNIMVPLLDFEVIKKDKKSFRKYLLVQNELLKFPICVYRISDTEYTALYMQCSHQGNELSAYGEKLHCSAHGSEFDKQGNVTSGPAEKNLKTFKVFVVAQNLKISLKKT